MWILNRRKTNIAVKRTTHRYIHGAEQNKRYISIWLIWRSRALTDDSGSSSFVFLVYLQDCLFSTFVEKRKINFQSLKSKSILYLVIDYFPRISLMLLQITIVINNAHKIALLKQRMIELYCYSSEITRNKIKMCTGLSKITFYQLYINWKAYWSAELSISKLKAENNSSLSHK